MRRDRSRGLERAQRGGPCDTRRESRSRATRSGHDPARARSSPRRVRMDRRSHRERIRGPRSLYPVDRGRDPRESRVVCVSRDRRATSRARRAAAAPRRGRQEPRPRLDRPACHHPILHGSRPRSTARRELHRHSDLLRARVGGDVDNVRTTRPRVPARRRPRSCIRGARNRIRGRQRPARRARTGARVRIRIPGATRRLRRRLPDLAAGQWPCSLSRPDRPRTASARGRCC